MADIIESGFIFVKIQIVIAIPMKGVKKTRGSERVSSSDSYFF